MIDITKDTDKQKTTYKHFVGGVNMGIGSFNLVRAIESIAVTQYTS